MKGCDFDPLSEAVLHREESVIAIRTRKRPDKVDGVLLLRCCDRDGVEVPSESELRCFVFQAGGTSTDISCYLPEHFWPIILLRHPALRFPNGLLRGHRESGLRRPVGRDTSFPLVLRGDFSEVKVMEDMSVEMLLTYLVIWKVGRILNPSVIRRYERHRATCPTAATSGCRESASVT